MHDDFTLLCIPEKSTIRQAINQLNANRLGLVMVVNSDRHLLGTITDGDIRRAVLGNRPLDSDISVLQESKQGTLYAKPITAAFGQSRDVYLKLLDEYKILHLPLLGSDNRVMGLIRRDDFVNRDMGVQALVMAGGHGTRLHPLTEHTPKPMLPVGDKPLMEIIISQLRDAGIRKVKVAISHQKEQISDYFKDGSQLNVEMSYLSEESPLGTAGALGLMEKTDQTILIINGDIMTNLDFRAMMAYHREQAADLTIGVREYDVKVPYGVIDCEGHHVSGVREKPVFSFFVNAGIYLLEPTMLDLLPKKGERLEMTDLIQHLIQQQRAVLSFPILEQWIDIGQNADYREAQKAAKTWGASL